MSDEYQKYLIDGLKISIIKTIAAFLNTRGGTLVVGVLRSKNKSDIICGVEPDYSTTGDWDGWKLRLDELLMQYFGNVSVSASNIVARHDSKLDKTLARISVLPTKVPKTWINVSIRKKDFEGILDMIQRGDQNTIKAIQAKFNEKIDLVSKLPVRNGSRTDLLDDKEFQDYISRH